MIAADHDRRYEIPGVPGPARRPVDIDASKTGFTRLRSFRIYRFEAGSVIDGHAEEDECFVVVTAGSVEMKIGWEDTAVDAEGVYTLTAPAGIGGEPFAVYLPPHAVYQLTPHTAADVAYARSTPLGSRAPRVFSAAAFANSTGITTLLEESIYAERLRLKVARIDTRNGELVTDLHRDAGCEALVHLQGSPAEHVGRVTGNGGESLQMQSWQTVALDPGVRAALHVAAGADLLMMSVLAV